MYTNSKCITGWIFFLSKVNAQSKFKSRKYHYLHPKATVTTTLQYKYYLGF